jgi:hypothetical protein
MSLALHSRRNRLLSVRTDVDAFGGGALWLLGGARASTPEDAPASAPLVIVSLAAVSFDLHATDAQLDLVPAQGFAGQSGQVTWGRFVNGAGAGVIDVSAGPPGSGKQVIIDNGQPVPSEQVYIGGQVDVTCVLVDP